MKNFHAGSHEVLIVPILVATAAPNAVLNTQYPVDGIYPVIKANAENLRQILLRNAQTNLPLTLDYHA